MLLVSSLDNTIRLFDNYTGKLLGSFTGHKNTDYPIQNTFDNKDATILRY
jgi:hypothetical protein